MEENIVKGKWNEFKGEVRNMWGKLTNDDLESTKGNLSAIAGLIQQRYGETKDSVTQKLNNLLNRGAGTAADATEDAKENLRQDNIENRH
jgi:uncharacterized protein YjbJ (UPF0337 family)